jgi:signal transduction histidine kinase
MENQTKALILSPSAKAALEASITLARFFAALVLLLLPGTDGRWRLYWVAGGLILLGSGTFVYGYLPSLVGTTDIVGQQYAALYASLAVWSAAGIFLNVGLLPSAPPKIPRWMIVGAAATLGVGCLFLAPHTEASPATFVPNDPGTGASLTAALVQLPPLYWVLAMGPLALAIAAAVGVVYRCAGPLSGWLGAGLVLYVGAQWHNLFWPTAYSSMLTPTTLLRFCSALVMAIGAVMELRRLVLEHATLLTIEQEYSRRLGEMAVLKADFTSMVAHELGTPLAAIRALTEMLASGAVGPSDQHRVFATIQAETEALSALVADVRTAATAEREDFAIRPRPIAVAQLLADARAFASSLPGEHPFTVTGTTSALVRADPERIGQVLRNLLSNAAKYSPPGTPIDIRAIPKECVVRIQVTDRGFGIHPYDLTRIFEKFERGSNQQGRKIHGVGLGLYLSRRIIQAHGAELTVESLPDVGSVFGFDLEVVR